MITYPIRIPRKTHGQRFREITFVNKLRLLKAASYVLYRNAQTSQDISKSWNAVLLKRK
jgi:hypothetical protein